MRFVVKQLLRRASPLDAYGIKIDTMSFLRSKICIMFKTRYLWLNDVTVAQILTKKIQQATIDRHIFSLNVKKLNKADIFATSDIQSFDLGISGKSSDIYTWKNLNKEG